MLERVKAMHNFFPQMIVKNRAPRLNFQIRFPILFSDIYNCQQKFRCLYLKLKNQQKWLLHEENWASYTIIIAWRGPTYL